jgi:hypothetical protein
LAFLEKLNQHTSILFLKNFVLKSLTMKLSVFSTGLALLLQLAAAVPTPTSDELVERANVVKRATITDAADSGYASTNGG